MSEETIDTAEEPKVEADTAAVPKGKRGRKAKDKAEEAAPEEQKDAMAALLSHDIIGKIHQKFGSSAVFLASDDRARAQYRISSGIFPLDFALGGGWTTNRIHILYGHKSSAKTTTLLNTIATAQKTCGECFTFIDEGRCQCGKPRLMTTAFIDVEGTFDPSWATAAGVDLSRVLLSSPEYAEQSLDIFEGLLRSENVDILCLDSIAFLSPKKEIESSMEAENPGIQARAMGKGMRKFVSALNFLKNDSKRRTTCFFTNQIRSKVGVIFGSSDVQPGGFAAGFAATSEVQFKTAKVSIDDETGRPTHATINFVVEKNKAGAPRMSSEFRIILQETEMKLKGEIADEDPLVQAAVRCKLIEGGGSHWKCFGESFGAKSLIEKKLQTDPAFKRKLWLATLAASNL